jgi:hypothetical protein
VGEQLSPVRVGQLAKRLIITGTGLLQRGLLHVFSMPF